MCSQLPRIDPGESARHGGLGEVGGSGRGTPEPAVPGYPGATMFHHFFL
jgi:hypothetical protein